MSERINDYKKLYNSLGSSTRLILRIWLLTTLWAVILAIITCSSEQYRLMLLCDDWLATIRSVAITGFAGTIAVRWIEGTK